MSRITDPDLKPPYIWKYRAQLWAAYLITLLAIDAFLYWAFDVLRVQRS